jgi:hypothetical protein
MARFQGLRIFFKNFNRDLEYFSKMKMATGFRDLEYFSKMKMATGLGDLEYFSKMKMATGLGEGGFAEPFAVRKIFTGPPIGPSLSHSRFGKFSWDPRRGLR